MNVQQITCRANRSVATALGLIVAVIMMPGVPAAQATTPTPTTLCTSFGLCTPKGYSNFGYSAYYRQSFWGMLPGHNCTNYVAYRLTHGRLVARPPGTVAASTWGPAARAAGILVDDRPKAGDVAWWGAGNLGSKSHVAVVERVESSGAVLISEDNYGGDFKWRRIVRGAPGWPSGFIHYPPSNGSPLGILTSVTSPTVGSLDFWATSADPDAGALIPSYLVTIGGPRGTAGIESFTFATGYFTFHRIKTVASRGTKPFYLYALNTPGTAGVDVLIGQKTVTIR